MLKNEEAAFAAFDAAMRAGKNKAEAALAAAEVEDRDIVDVFNDMLDTGRLAFVSIDRSSRDKKNPEGRPLVRVIDPDGRRVVDNLWLVK